MICTIKTPSSHAMFNAYPRAVRSRCFVWSYVNTRVGSRGQVRHKKDSSIVTYTNTAHSHHLCVYFAAQHTGYWFSITGVTNKYEVKKLVCDNLVKSMGVRPWRGNKNKVPDGFETMASQVLFRHSNLYAEGTHDWYRLFSWKVMRHVLCKILQCG